MAKFFFFQLIATTTLAICASAHVIQPRSSGVCYVLIPLPGTPTECTSCGDKTMVLNTKTKRCECAPGTGVPVQGPYLGCDLCAKGTYSVIRSGNQFCDPCPAGKTTTGTGSSSCIDNPPCSLLTDTGCYSCSGAGMKLTAAGGKCVCQPGYGPNGNTCRICNASEYSDDGTACKPCNGWTDGSGSTSCRNICYYPADSGCGACDTSRHLQNMSGGRCICSPGYVPINNICTICPAGTYSTGSACKTCPLGTSSNAGEVACSSSSPGKIVGW